MTQAQLAYAYCCSETPDEADVSLLPTMTEEGLKTQDAQDGPPPGEKLTAQEMEYNLTIAKSNAALTELNQAIVAHTHHDELCCLNNNDVKCFHVVTAAATAATIQTLVTTLREPAPFLLREIAVPVVPGLARIPPGALLDTLQNTLATTPGVRVMQASLAAIFPVVSPEKQTLLAQTPLHVGSDLECCVLVTDGTVTLRMYPTKRMHKAYAAFALNKHDAATPKFVQWRLSTVPATVGTFTLCHIGTETRIDTPLHDG